MYRSFRYQVLLNKKLGLIMKKIVRNVMLFFLIFVVFAIGISVALVYRIVNIKTQKKLRTQESCIHRQQYCDELIREHHAQKVTFESEDRIRLSGLLIKRAQAKRVWLICHGYYQSKESMRSLVDIFPEDTLLLLDFRTHGESQGDRISFGIYESNDILAAVKFLKNHEDTRTLPVIGFGVSMGASALIKAAYEGAPFAALVLDSAFASLDEQMYRSFALKSKLPGFMYPVARFIFEKFIRGKMAELEPIAMIEHLNIPIFIIQSCMDTMVSPHDAHRLYNHIQGYKKIWISPANKHCKSFWDFPQEYKQQIENFLSDTEKLRGY